MDDKTFENRAQMGPKTEHRRGTPSALGHDPMGYPRVPREKIRKKNQRNKKEGSTSGCPPILSEKVANMAPSWVPSWSQKLLDIYPNKKKEAISYYRTILLENTANMALSWIPKSG